MVDIVDLNGNPIQPRSKVVRVDWECTEVIDHIFNEMTADEKYSFFNTRWEDLIGYHHTLGMWIRNTFGLWAKHPLLLASMCLPLDNHPDETSQKLIEALWLSVRDN
ncbi:MAG: hypothetical protein GY753_11900 [Gammaproteobacteria bacterium]|nr:hypothetical protein [Gammaproteobacteria bacterium]